MFVTAKIVAVLLSQYLCQFLKFYNFTAIITDSFVSADIGNQLKVRPNAMMHWCNNEPRLTVHARWQQCWLMRHQN